MTEHRTLPLDGGSALPMVGLGVFYQGAPDETVGAVEAAIHAADRLIDTAAHRNKAEVGEGIRRGGIARTDIFVTTKLWVSDYGHHAALRGFEASMGKLGLDTLDLFLLHWPVPARVAQTLTA